MRRRAAAWCAIIAAAAVILAGCGGNDAGAGRGRASAARSQALAGILALARRINAAGLGPVSGSGKTSRFMEGKYVPCRTGLDYSNGFWLAPVSEATGRSAAYRQRVAGALSGGGWRLRTLSTPRHEEPFGYGMSRPGSSGSAVASLRHGGIIAVLVSVDGRCFDPGPARASLQHTSDQVAVPRASPSQS